MKKTRITLLISLIALLLAALAAPLTALAADDLRRVPEGERLPRFIDDKNLLTEGQAAELLAKLDEISERHEFDTIVLVVDDITRWDIRTYAADFYEQNGFGYGNSTDGIILVLAMRHREFGFVTTGYGLYAFTDPGQEYMEKLFLPDLKADRFFKGFMAYADAVDDFLTKAEAGRPYDKGNIPLTAQERQELNNRRLVFGVVGLLLSLLIPAIITGVWKAKMKSIRKVDIADEYIRQGSMVLNVQQDIFLHRHVSRTKRESSSSGGGGGSSGSFKSSSGSSFSGRSGKF